MATAEQMRAYRATPEGAVKSRESNRRSQRKFRKANPHVVREDARAYRDKLRREFFAEYGEACKGTSSGEPCPWGVVERDALTIGHLFNDGAAHKRRVGQSCWAVLSDLRRRGWPKNEGISTQCGSCQMVDHRRSYAKGAK